MVHTIKGEYDSYKGYESTTNWKRRRIQRFWSAIPIMLDAGDDVKWNYVSPSWSFPPLAPFLVQTTRVKVEEAIEAYWNGLLM